jgi:hypothetical protein
MTDFHVEAIQYKTTLVQLKISEAVVVINQNSCQNDIDQCNT